MRIIALAVALLVSSGTARADEITLAPREVGALFEWRDINLSPARADGMGFVARGVLGHCRFGLLGELGGGWILDQTNSVAGEYGSLRIGGRLVLARLRARGDPLAVDLVLDAGVGGNLYHVGPSATQPEAFIGWATVIDLAHVAFEMQLRVEAAPSVNDSVTNAICRGTCGPAPASSLDTSFTLLLGVMSW